VDRWSRETTRWATKRPLLGFIYVAYSFAGFQNILLLLLNIMSLFSADQISPKYSPEPILEEQKEAEWRSERAKKFWQVSASF
jgi:hypothetical protein